MLLQNGLSNGFKLVNFGVYSPGRIGDIGISLQPIEVNGKNATPLYKFLKSEKGGYFGDTIRWNFTKFLVNKEGKVVERYAPTTSPLKIDVRAFFLYHLIMVNSVNSS
ncbi:hypothetical protein CRYUN_Cryun18bG0144800 [Craigia yunnanensis]